MPKHEFDTHDFLFDGTCKPLDERLALTAKSVADRVAAMRDEEVAAVDAEALAERLVREFALKVPRLDLPAARVERIVLDTEAGLVPNTLRVSIPISGDATVLGLPLPTPEGEGGDWRMVRWSIEKQELHLYAGVAGEGRAVGVERGAALGAALRGLRATLGTLEDGAAAWNAAIPLRMHEALDGRQATLRAKADYLAAFREAMLEAAVASLSEPPHTAPAGHPAETFAGAEHEA